MGVGTGTDGQSKTKTIAANEQGGSLDIQDHTHTISATSSEAAAETLTGGMGIANKDAFNSSSTTEHTGDSSTSSGDSSATSSTELPGDANSPTRIFCSQKGSHASSRIWYTFADYHQFKTSGTSSNSWRKIRYAMGHSHSANHGHSYSHHHSASHSHGSAHTHSIEAHAHTFAHTHTFTGTSGSTGAGTSGNLQPCIGVYMWKRIA
jgi:hypothetical protein